MPEQAPALKYDNGKRRWDLVPFECLDALADIYTFGAAKYQPNSWQQLEDFDNRYFAAILRHLSAWRQGEWLDQESGYPHLAHAMWGCCALLWAGLRK